MSARQGKAGGGAVAREVANASSVAFEGRTDAVSAGIDAFVTGEMHYHEYFGREQQIQIAVIGHYQSEQFTSEIFREIIENSCEGVKCFIADTCTNPIMYF